MALTQMMQQYFDLKEKHKDYILFFRLGDFYEMFFEDAETASRELELTLTGRDCGLPERAPMCGVPYHSCETYIARLIKKGYKVAIAEQMEAAGKGVKLVSREVVRLITPGTLIEDNMLEAGKNNYICALYIQGKKAGLAFCDISTGELNAMETQGEDVGMAVVSELTRFAPSEILSHKAIASHKDIVAYLQARMPIATEQLGEKLFAYNDNADFLLKHFGKEDVEELGLGDKPLATAAAGVLLRHIYDTQSKAASRITAIDLYADSQYMNLNVTALQNLELIETMRTGERKGSLLWVLDHTKTAMGKRLLKKYIIQPLLNPVAIDRRLDAVEAFVNDPILRGDIGDLLGDIYDLQRLLTRVVYGTANPREIRSLAYTATKLPLLKERLRASNTQATLLRQAYKEMDPLEDLRVLIESSIEDEPPALLRDGGFIRQGFNADVDELRSIITDSKTFLAEIESQEKAKTGIKSLKIKYNKVFGYFIQITNSYLDQVPETYIRKQTIAGGERFITQELKELEQKILGASERVIQLETALFEEIRGKVAEAVGRIQLTARAVARLDVFYSLAQAAALGGYCRPKVDLSGAVRIGDGRHPVVERTIDEPFVSNDTQMDQDKNRIMLITGPNMAGKSTYMRQVAVIVLLAQIGCFVPASSATVGIVDSIFTRIGASDDLSAGKSTFMIEMSEVAQILKNATANSLIILDEIGRGTSTYDGMSMARAVLEHISNKRKLGAKTLFATHYHELTELEETVDGINNYNVAVKKRGDEITFMRRITRGAADDSYGIEVSKLAGIPESVIIRAKEILGQLEEGKEIQVRKSIQRKDEPVHEAFPLMDMQNRQVMQKLKDVDVEVLTPLEALNLLHQLKKDIQ